ncbi:histidinol-phosphate transaminase [Niabella ginsengisoli]|uniref:Histidinol-phosphate aminotransferase n=1 Tax=Niabella ginsengisoli TaxID=522298 RepID=A0ABS9SHB5_9BACT|nr:histidinol-phosphate transaminase [Niabella ginsengisoli]MCH5597763.1 histidinol-phosphate transaminase [Niabella ginsengisoli]
MNETEDLKNLNDPTPPPPPERGLVGEAFNLDYLVRENIRTLAPYTTARHEFTGEASVMLDANENAIGSPVTLDIGASHELLNRYPDPLQMEFKKRIGEIKGIPVENIFAGNGSDEAIDVLMRIFCEPGIDNIITLPPTYGMYSVCAAINNIKVKEVPLNKEYQMDIQAIADAVDENTKLIFICSPNNPTGNSITRQDIEIILNNFDGIVVIDEAYINYAKQKTFSQQVSEYPNLIVMQTLSKAWGLAALRLGLAFASKDIINLMNNVKYPYNINEATQQLALQGLKNVMQVNEWTKTTIEQRNWLEEELRQLSFVERIFPSDANFLLVKMNEADAIFVYLQTKGIIVRSRTKTKGCESCLRITVGTEKENKELIKALKAHPNPPQGRA